MDDVERYLKNSLKEDEGLHFEGDIDETYLEKLATKVFNPLLAPINPDDLPPNA